MDSPTRLFISSENRLFCDCLAATLERQDDIIVVGTGPGNDEVLQRIRECRSEVTLIALGAEAESVLRLARRIRALSPEVRVIVAGLPDHTEEILECLEAGAAGYIVNRASFADLIEVIRRVHHGESLCQPRIIASLFQRVAELATSRSDAGVKRRASLTKREQEILRQAAKGLANKEIAHELSIEPQTVKNHMHNLLDKLQLDNRIKAIEYARSRGLL